MKKKRSSKKYSGFTLVEMLIVLLVIAVLVLLFVPNLSKQREGINQKGDEAFRQVVTTQIELYEIDNPGQTATFELLTTGKYLTNKQVKRVNDMGLSIADFTP